MDKKSIRVKLIGKQKGYYKIAFSNFTIPVEVDENLYRGMKHSPDYHFLGHLNSKQVHVLQKNVQ